MSAGHLRLVTICFLAFVCWVFSTPSIVSSSHPDLPQANVPADSAQGGDDVVPVLGYGDAQRSGVFSTRALDEAPRQILWKSKKLFQYRESNPTVAMSGPIRIVADIPTFQTITRPIVSNGMIFFIFSTENAYLYAINASTGDELVVLKFAKNILSSPSALGGTVFFGDRNAAHAFDFERRVERWAFTRRGLSFSYGPPVIDNGIIYMYGSGAGAGLYALSAATGEAKWVFESAQFLSGPAISGDKLILVNSQGSLLALDKTSGAKQWETKIDSEAFAPAILGDQIFVRFKGGNIRAYRLTDGSLKWKAKESGGARTALVLFQGKVIYGGREDSLVALDAKTGIESWKFRTNRPCHNPLIAGGRLYAICEDHKLYSIDPLTGVETWRVENKNDQSPIFAAGVMYMLGTNGILSAMK